MTSIIMGIDPGSRFAGFGVLQRTSERVEHLASGTLVLPTQLDFARRLARLSEDLQKLYARFHPDCTVIEKIFLGKNADSAFRLGHARGVCLCQAASHGSRIFEYATRSVKKGVTGNGGACKETVQMILFAELGLSRTHELDASDALALAFYHAREISVRENLARQSSGENSREHALRKF